MKLDIARIQVGQRKRKLDEGKVRSLAESFESIGQLQPITVGQCENGNYRMIAGLHRLEAAKLLGWESIEAQEFEGDAVAAELAEIDENLMRNDLTVLEQGEHLARRQELVGFKQGDNRFTIGRRATVAPLKTTFLRTTRKAGSFANWLKSQPGRRLKKQPEIPTLCACGVIHRLQPKLKETAGEIQRPGVIAESCPARARTGWTSGSICLLLNLVGKNT